MVRSLRRPDEEGKAGGSRPAGRLPPSPPPAPCHGGSVPGSAAGGAREAGHKPPLKAGERRSRGGGEREGPGGGRRAEIRSSNEKWSFFSFFLLKTGANLRARQTLPFPLAPSQRALGKPQPRRALPPGRAASAEVSVFSSESRARQGPSPGPKPAGCAAPRAGLHIYNAQFSLAEQGRTDCATSFHVVETLWGNYLSPP